MMNTKNLAVAILMSLGVTACSVGSGNGSSGNPVENPKSTTATTTTTTTTTSTTTATTTDKTDEQKAVAEDAEKEAEAKKAAADAAAKLAEEQKAAADAAAKLAEEQKTAEAEAAAKKAAEEAAAAAEAARIAAEEAAKKAAELAKVNAVKKVATIYFADKTESYTYKRVSDPAEYAKLVEEAKAAANFPANNCANNPTSGCRGEGAGAAESGKVMKSYKGSYSGYAVLRETYTSSDANGKSNAENGIPTNAFFYYVDTPTTDKSKVVNAKYTGSISYSKDNNPAVANNPNNTTFYMEVNNDTVSGLMQKTYGVGSTPKTIDMIKFNSASITVDEKGAIGFSGTTEFNGHYMAFSYGTENGNDEGVSFSGTYKGQFAGANAEEMTGTFESDTTERERSVQGAFSVKK